MIKKLHTLKKYLDRFFYSMTHWFIAGAVILIPFCVTIFLIFYPLNWLSNFIGSFTNTIFAFFLTSTEADGLEKAHALFILLKRYANNDTISLLNTLTRVPYMSLFLVTIFVTLFGLLTTTGLMRSSVELIERIIIKIPILNLLYSYAKESTAGFFGKFNKPVLVCIDEELGIQKIGFITQEDLHNLEVSATLIAIYIPHSYSFSGELSLFPRTKVKRLKISSTEAWKVVLSGGLAEIKRLPVKQKK